MIELKTTREELEASRNELQSARFYLKQYEDNSGVAVAELKRLSEELESARRVMKVFETGTHDQCLKAIDRHNKRFGCCTMPTPRTDAVYELNKAHWSADMMTPFARQLESENEILRNGMKQILEGVFEPKMIATRVLYHLDMMKVKND